jgi:hypothetical protein
MNLAVRWVFTNCRMTPQQKARADRMKRLTRRRRQTLPNIVSELMVASWETIARRGALVAQGTCAPSEYQRMFMEKAAALQHSALALVSGRGTGAILAPWHKRATANAKRLRRRR